MVKKKEVAAAPAGLPPTYILREPTFSFLALESCTWLVCNLYRPRSDLCFPFLIQFALFFFVIVISYTPPMARSITSKPCKMADESGQHQPRVVVFKQFGVVVHAQPRQSCRALPTAPMPCRPCSETWLSYTSCGQRSRKGRHLLFRGRAETMGCGWLAPIRGPIAMPVSDRFVLGGFKFVHSSLFFIILAKLARFVLLNSSLFPPSPPC